MLATIILDSFMKSEAPEIAEALDMICSPEDNYGFASACIYAFWSVPERDVLYIGLARDVAMRFRQHTGLRACDPACCKREQIDAYFKAHSRLGYSIMVQSPLDQPVTETEREELAELYDEAFAADVADYFPGEENVIVAEGFLLELHRQLGDRLPPWNKIHGAERGRQRRPLSEHREQMRVMVEMVRTGKQPGEIVREMAGQGPPYELLLNLTGYELSDLNAKSTLRLIASDATVEGHEEFLHGVRLHMLLHGTTFDDSIRFQLRHNPYAPARVEAMRQDGYLHRTPVIPGLAQPASGGKTSGEVPR